MTHKKFTILIASLCIIICVSVIGIVVGITRTRNRAYVPQSDIVDLQGYTFEDSTEAFSSVDYNALSSSIDEVKSNDSNIKYDDTINTDDVVFDESVENLYIEDPSQYMIVKNIIYQYALNHNVDAIEFKVINSSITEEGLITNVTSHLGDFSIVYAYDEYGLYGYIIE